MYNFATDNKSFITKKFFHETFNYLFGICDACDRRRFCFPEIQDCRSAIVARKCTASIREESAKCSKSTN